MEKTAVKNPKVILAGAGPGAEDLLTIRALNAIKNAEIILYDALVGKAILRHAKPSAKCIYVGKRFNNHKYPQEEINRMLVYYARRFGTVLRLKGGDPFVFGRGAEELDFAESRGIETEIIPGISSALSVPASQGIPLTKRGVSEGFWVITGTVSDGSISKDISLGAQSSSTLIVLMGLRNFSRIITEVSKYRPARTPFAIIQNGTLPNENILTTTLADYKNIIDLIDYSSPGIIVIGEVVAENRAFLEEEIQRVLEIAY